MMQHLDHLTLHLFIRIFEESTIARAKERAFIAPSAVSKRGSDIETRLSARLNPQELRPGQTLSVLLVANGIY
ncbi:hypothetical protein D3C84_991700 [compost metagenome]